MNHNQYHRLSCCLDGANQIGLYTRRIQGGTVQSLSTGIVFIELLISPSYAGIDNARSSNCQYNYIAFFCGFNSFVKTTCIQIADATSPGIVNLNVFTGQLFDSLQERDTIGIAFGY